MKRALKKCGICFFMSLLFVFYSSLFNACMLELPFQEWRLFYSGFAAYAAVNPVSLFVTETNEGFLAEIILEENLQIQAFQMRLCFDGKKLNIQTQDNYYQPAFLDRYNGNQAALLNHNLLNQGKQSSLILLGLQTDETCAAVSKETTLATVAFQYALADADVAEQAQALDTVYLQVEVLEGKEGNLVQGQDAWRIKPFYKNQQTKEPNNNKLTENNETSGVDGSEENQTSDDRNDPQKSNNDNAGDLKANNDNNALQAEQNDSQNDKNDGAQSNEQDNLGQNAPQEADDWQTENPSRQIKDRAPHNTSDLAVVTENAKKQNDVTSKAQSQKEKQTLQTSLIWLCSILLIALGVVALLFAVLRRKKS